MFAALAATVAACHKEDARPKDGTDTRRRMEVRIDAPATRTALGDDGASACWVKGDRLALWAYGADAPAFEQVPFRFWYRKQTPDKGMFVGMVDPMAPGTYTYYGAYPLPETADGTKVTYTIPSMQNGAWNGQLDIMLAATQGAELQEEILNEVTLRFHHKVHVLKVTVPQGRNRLGNPIERLHIEFPRPVAGRMTWDLTAPEAAPEMAATSNAVTLEFDEPIDEGDTFWVYLAPADLRGGEVRFTATDGTEFSWPLTTAGFDDCRAGMITPVNLTVAEARPQADFRIAIDPAHLGETVTQIDSLSMPDGYEFPALGRCRTLKTFVKNNDGTFTARIFNDQADAFAQGMEVGLTVSSENTEGVYGKRCQVSGVSAGSCTIAAPYLFFEDFSEAAGHDAYADENGTNAYEMTEAGLPGWTGSRWKTEANTSLEFRTYVGTAVGPSAKYGRTDTPILPIRKGRTVNAMVHYEIGATINYGSSTFTSSIHAVCIFGWSTQAGPVAGGNNSSQNYPQNRIDEYQTDKNGSPTNLPTVKDTPVSGLTEGARLTWFGSYQRTGIAAITGATFYYYIDNVRVTIVQ